MIEIQFLSLVLCFFFFISLSLWEGWSPPEGLQAVYTQSQSLAKGTAGRGNPEEMLLPIKSSENILLASVCALAGSGVSKRRYFINILIGYFRHDPSRAHMEVFFYTQLVQSARGLFVSFFFFCSDLFHNVCIIKWLIFKSSTSWTSTILNSASELQAGNWYPVDVAFGINQD